MPLHLTQCLANRRQKNHLGMKIILLFYFTFHGSARADSPVTPPSTTLAPSSRGTGLESPNALYSLLLALILWATLSYYRNPPWHHLIWVRLSCVVPLYPVLPLFLHIAYLSVMVCLACTVGIFRWDCDILSTWHIVDYIKVCWMDA